ncbi:DinB family protein [Kribbella sp. NPDC048915]|uniref:DinB family protein n=1 Tax=Kribbella sp. NPDC048915 TaxID=3155148 RepID=UPI00340CC901
MEEFRERDLAGARFEESTLRGAVFHDVDLRGARLENVDLTGTTIRGARLVDVSLDGEIRNLRVWGIDVVPLIDAELNRLYPGRERMRPTDPDGYREAWDLLEQLWAETVAKARRLPPGTLHESVDGEWSFIETLRHLVFVTDAWIRRTVLGVAEPWDPLGLPHDEFRDTPPVPRDRAARPALDDVLALREDRAVAVRQLMAELTADRLRAPTPHVPGPGYPPPSEYSVGECLSVLLDEEFEQRRFAERDLATLQEHVGGES